MNLFAVESGNTGTSAKGGATLKWVFVKEANASAGRPEEDGVETGDEGEIARFFN